MSADINTGLDGVPATHVRQVFDEVNRRSIIVVPGATAVGEHASVTRDAHGREAAVLAGSKLRKQGAWVEVGILPVAVGNDAEIAQSQLTDRSRTKDMIFTRTIAVSLISEIVAVPIGGRSVNERVRHR